MQNNSDDCKAASSGRNNANNLSRDHLPLEVKSRRRQMERLKQSLKILVAAADDWRQKWRRYTARRSVRFTLASAGALLLVSLLVWALRSESLATIELQPWPLLAVVVIAMPFQLLLHALELRLSSAYGDRPILLVQGFKYSLTAAAANLLPMPGHAMVSWFALRAHGVSRRQASALVGISYAAWIASALFIIGAFLHADLRHLSYALLASGGALAAITIISARLGAVGIGTLSGFVALRSASIASLFVQLSLIMTGLGLDYGITEVAGFALARISAGVASTVPAGIGIQELAGALVAQLIFFPAALGVIIMFVSRVLRTAFIIAAVTLTVGWRAPAEIISDHDIKRP
jgi:hypothetical protein